MTQAEKRISQLVVKLVDGLTLAEAIDMLILGGLIDYRAVERKAIFQEIIDLGRQGIPRCTAIMTAAQTFNCSYEKARNAFYNQFKPI